MARIYRFKCACGKVQDAEVDAVCKKCKQPLLPEQQGLIRLYRMGNFFGCGASLKLFLDGERIGGIKNCETLDIPVPYGTHTVHVMNKKCKTLTVTLTPENRSAYAKAKLIPGFWVNSFEVNESTAEEMPE